MRATFLAAGAVLLIEETTFAAAVASFFMTGAFVFTSHGNRSPHDTGATCFAMGAISCFPWEQLSPHFSTSHYRSRFLYYGANFLFIGSIVRMKGATFCITGSTRYWEQLPFESNFRYCGSLFFHNESKSLHGNNFLYS